MYKLKSFIISMVISFIFLFSNRGYAQNLNNLLLQPNKEISNIKIYKANTTGQIEELIRDKRSIHKDNNNFYFTNGFTGYKKHNNLKEKHTEIVYEELLYILNNLNLDLDIFGDLSVFISPHRLISVKHNQEVNGYYTACISGTCDNPVNKMIILSIDNDVLLDFNYYIYRAKVRRTILHELGHVINRELIRKDKSEYDFWKKIDKIYPNISNEDQSIWKLNKKENFAEDMVYILGQGLNRKPFLYKWKRTNYKFNNDMINVLEDHLLNTKAF